VRADPGGLLGEETDDAFIHAASSAIVERSEGRMLLVEKGEGKGAAASVPASAHGEPEREQRSTRSLGPKLRASFDGKLFKARQAPPCPRKGLRPLITLYC
jgi:hypothetical protein